MLLLSGQKFSGAKTQSKITYDPCDMLEIMDNPPTAVKCQQLPGQIPLGFQTCAIPKAGPATAPDSWSSKTQRQPGSCYKCGQQGHWTCICPKFCKPKGLCPRCHQERHWASDCPHIVQDKVTSLPDNPSANLLGLAMDH